MAVEVLDDSTFKDALKNSEKTIVKYYAGWCGSCRLFSPKFKRLSNDERFTNVRFIDIDAEKNPEARKLAGVSNLPFFATFKGDELVESSPTSKEDKVVEMLENLKN
ncbi:MAG: thioredoxin family protein [Candidatus Cyclobacteriaceae bacterium M2_1C_046]